MTIHDGMTKNVSRYSTRVCDKHVQDPYYNLGVVSKAQSKKDLSTLGSSLATLRKRPCVFLVDGFLERDDVLEFRKAVSGVSAKEIDVIIFSPGGDPDAAYLLGRELGRRFDEVTAFIPLYAKSGATLVCLAAHELVLSDVGELGPIDVQEHEAEPGTFADYRSCLERFKALEALQRHAIETLDIAVQMLLQQQMNLMDACKVAVEFTGKLMDPLYAQVQPAKVAQSARYLEIAEQYAERLLRRYRPEIRREQRVILIRALGRRYPSHSFILDLEELVEMGLSARRPTPDEARILDQMVPPLRFISGFDDTWFQVCDATPAKKAKPTTAKKSKSRSRRPKAVAEAKPEAASQTTPPIRKVQ